MSERIEFIEPVVVQGSEIGLAVARGLDCGRVVINGELWGMEYIDDPSEARVKAAKKLALAHLEARKVADKVDAFEKGCFAIDRDGRKWEWGMDQGNNPWYVSSGFWMGLMELEQVLGATWYKPRPVGEMIEFDGVTYIRRSGKWQSAAGTNIEGHYACALDLILSQKQRIAELEKLKEAARLVAAALSQDQPVGPVEFQMFDMALGALEEEEVSK